ncbi:MAG: hypothetical protein ACREQ5_01515 [Candidatus Dormibacteria bacterium]
MAQLFIDAYGHEVRPIGQQGVALTAGLVTTSAAGTISPTNSAGTASTVTVAAGSDDRSGSFTLLTSTTSLAAGQQVVVRFKQPYAVIPKAVIVTAVDTTDTTASITVGANLVTAAGFDIVGTLPVTGKSYVINYLVIP